MENVFGSGSGPGPFLAPGARFEGRVGEGRVRELRFKRSGTVLALRASFEGSSTLTVSHRFWPWEPGLIEERISSPGPF